MVIAAEHFVELVENPELLRKEHNPELKKLIEEYPYFQTARALHLKALKNSNNFRYNHELKVCAAYTTDRAVLFDFITSEGFNRADLIQKDEPAEAALNEEYQNDLEIGKPLSFTRDDKHSFNEWLQLSKFQPIEREETNSEDEDQFKIIDRFIRNNPKIIPVDKKQDVSVNIGKNKQDQSLMTETLAKVYLEQKKFGKAIKAYEILSLKYPEKSGFFADQIKRIKTLKHNKS